MQSLFDLFDDRGTAAFTSAQAAAAVEDSLRERGLSFRTIIVKTRKRGLEYRVQLLNGA